jgi:hypothetical protein
MKSAGQSAGLLDEWIDGYVEKCAPGFPPKNPVIHQSNNSLGLVHPWLKKGPYANSN